MVKKYRGLFEGPEWDESRREIEPDPERFDAGFRFAAHNISTEPRTNTTPFLSESHRILVFPISYYGQLWVYFRIEPDDESCTLLWIEERKHDLELRPG
jgi:hypothetical protein